MALPAFSGAAVASSAVAVAPTQSHLAYVSEMNTQARLQTECQRVEPPSLTKISKAQIARNQKALLNNRTDDREEGERYVWKNSQGEERGLEDPEDRSALV
eukprot:TRINITY_DN187_c0_g1_i3.p1 TRINITY_DN187_c0_g1~~TRINITY_DN187_c0_g1_i3.p1  ORF type:complete len:101 (+),score=25.39 TRINITY_DN187_c0_g1_i3:250-552(+)